LSCSMILRVKSLQLLRKEGELEREMRGEERKKVTVGHIIKH